MYLQTKVASPSSSLLFPTCHIQVSFGEAETGSSGTTLLNLTWDLWHKTCTHGTLLWPSSCQQQQPPLSPICITQRALQPLWPFRPSSLPSCYSWQHIYIYTHTHTHYLHQIYLLVFQEWDTYCSFQTTPATGSFHNHNLTKTVLTCVLESKGRFFWFVLEAHQVCRLVHLYAPKWVG